MTWVHITSVLYGNDEAATERLVVAGAHAAGVARAAGTVDRVTYAIGDSSATPAVSDECVKRITERAARDEVDLTYEFFNANLGSAEGNNALMRGVAADFFLMLNPDVYASPNLLTTLLARFADPTIGIADARQVPFDHPKAYDTETGDTSWASMACCLLRGDAVRAVGELDSATFFLYCDDVDYSWRTRLAGYRVVHEPRAVAFHDKRPSANGSIVPTAVEDYYAAEAALLLTYKYSRSDLTEKLLAAFQHGPEHHRRARREFFERRRSHRLPTPLDTDHRVAEFVAGNYATHRF